MAGASEVYRVAYQGVPGAYSEQAVLQLFHTQPVQVCPKDQFDDCFKAVEKGEVDFALMPLENTLGGSIHANYDLMLRYNLHLVAETQLRVRHCLLANAGVTKQDIKTVMSHPQALAQCDGYSKRQGYTQHAFHDTAASGKKIKEDNSRDVAAIASSRAAEVFGLEILDQGIEDDDNNFTRFGLLSKTPVSLLESDTAVKTSIVLSLTDSPGALFKAMACFSMRDIDLLKIESRPKGPIQTPASPMSPVSESTHQQGNAINQVAFYLDFLANLNEERTKNALLNLKELAPFIRVFGSYPVALPGEPGPPKHIPLKAPMTAPVPTSATKSPSVAIVGFGTFGQFLAKAFVRQGHPVFATSRTDYSSVARQLGVTFCPTEEALLQQNFDAVIFCTSILSFESVLKKFPTERLKGKLVVDVLSVKGHAKSLMQQLLPEDCDILCTHPMFGPESGKHSWNGLPFVYEKVRIADQARCRAFLNLFSGEGCRMEPMTCEDHDQYAAGSQFITHATGRMLGQLGIGSTPINTKGFESLLTLVDNTSKDSMDLFIALYQHNPAAHQQLERLEQALRAVKASLVEAKL